MAYKLKEVQSWLCSIFGDCNVLQFEINEKNVDYMYKLFSRCRSREKLVELELTDLEQKSSDYEAEVNRIVNIIDSLGLKEFYQTDPALKTLSDVGKSLKISDTSQTKYFFGLQDLKHGFHTSESDIVSKQTNSAQIHNKIEIAQSKCTSLERALFDLDLKAHSSAPKLKKKNKETRTILSKSKDYRTALENFKATASIYIDHSTLVNKSEVLAAIEAKLVPLNKQLQSYHYLPPNIPATKVKIEELKREIETVETALSAAIDQMHIQ